MSYTVTTARMRTQKAGELARAGYSNTVQVTEDTDGANLAPKQKTTANVELAKVLQYRYLCI